MAEKKTHCECGVKLVLYVDQVRGRCHACSEALNQRSRPLKKSRTEQDLRRSDLLNRSIETLAISERCQVDLLDHAVEAGDRHTLQEALDNTRLALSGLEDWQNSNPTQEYS